MSMLPIVRRAIKCASLACTLLFSSVHANSQSIPEMPLKEKVIAYVPKADIESSPIINSALPLSITPHLPESSKTEQYFSKRRLEDPDSLEIQMAKRKERNISLSYLYSPLADTIFSTNPKNRPKEPMPLLLNRLNERLSTTISYYSQDRFNFLFENPKRGFLEVMNKDMQRATQRGFESTLEAYFAGNAEDALRNSSFAFYFEEKIIRGFSGWESDRLQNPFNVKHEGLAGTREYYLPEGFDWGLHLATRTPKAELRYVTSSFKIGVQASAVSLVNPLSFSRPKPNLIFIGEMPIKRDRLNLTAGLQASHNTSSSQDLFNSYVGLNGRINRNGFWNLGGNPEQGEVGFSFSLRY